jgi:signal transduction histidine kinase
MIGGVVALAIAAIGAAYAGLAIKADPRRRDNLMFGALALTDASMTAWRGINVLSGDSIVADSVTLPCSIATILLAVFTIEFIYGFPRRECFGWRWRTALIAWAFVGALVCILCDWKGDWNHTASEWVFFAPATVLIVVLGWRSWMKTSDRDARTVIGMLWFRWVFGFSSYFLGPRLGIFEQAVWAETTIATLISFVVIGTAVLRSELFSIRGVAAEALLVSTIAMLVLLTGGVTIFAVLAWTDPGTLQTALLVGATLVPLHAAYLAQRLYPRLEKNVLAPLDDRRARRLGVQGEPLPAGADAAIEESIRRMRSISDGATVTWDRAIAGSEPVREGTRFIFPAIGSHTVGGFVIDGGLVDRDTFVVARDLAARVALAVEREQAVSELEDARRLAALGSFAAAIAHDIRTPLTSISLNVQILRRKLQLSADDREHLDIALEELARLDRSVAEILDFAKPVKLAPQPVDVAELLADTTRGLSPVLSEKQIALRCEPGDALAVTGDPQRLRQVLVNLVGNAAEASQPGAEVTIRAKTADSRVAIEVEDHGRGIGAADLARIFEPFFTTRPDGTGLGLAICHKVVRAHGGDIVVRSTPGEGSTFTVLLPAA